MSTKNPVSSASSNVVRMSAAVAAMTAAMLALTTGAALRHLNQGSTVQITPSDFTWWSQLDIGFDSVAQEKLPYNAFVATPVSLSALNPQLVASVGSAPMKLHTARFVSRRTLAARASKHFTHVSSVASTEPAAKLVQPIVLSAPAPVVMTEAEKMRAIHMEMRSRFRLALNTQPLVPATAPTVFVMTTQNELVPGAHVEAPAPVSLKQKVSRHFKKLPDAVSVRAVHVAAAVPAKSAALRSELPAAGNTLALASARAMDIQQSAVSEIKVSKDSDEGLQRDSIRSAQSHAVAPSLELLSQKLTLSEAGPMNSQGARQMIASNAPGSGYSKVIQPSEYPSLNHLTSQAPSGDAPQSPHLSIQSDAPVLAACAPESQGVGAFSEGKNWFSIFKKVLSEEGSENGTQSKWVISSSQAKRTHWSTLSLEKGKPAHCTPLLTVNDVSALSILSKVTILGDTGIVFGKVPAGWELDLRSRSEQPIYFDENLKPIAVSADRARYFAFVNVAPGIPLLYLNAANGGSTAAISLPVKPGVATYIELSAPEKKKINGGIYLASSSKQKGMSGLSINVVGQDGKTAISNRSGGFRLDDVLVIGEHPLYLDVTLNDKAFKHRYKVMADQTQNLSLFHFSEKEVTYWISQLEGGVSPASGIIVSADRNIKENESKRPLPSVIPLLEKPTLSSETYTLSPEDHLLVKAPMRIGQGRFISVQVPEGANMPSLITPDGKVLWSQLVVSQPGVINVIDKN